LRISCCLIIWFKERIESGIGNERAQKSLGEGKRGVERGEVRQGRRYDTQSITEYKSIAGYMDGVTEYGFWGWVCIDKAYERPHQNSKTPHRKALMR
jgi:hypothetical protein